MVCACVFASCFRSLSRSSKLENTPENIDCSVCTSKPSLKILNLGGVQESKARLAESLEAEEKQNELLDQELQSKSQEVADLQV